MFTATLHEAIDSIPRLDLLLLARQDTGEAAGFAFFNVGSGLESGGDYLWLNEIHVTAKLRGQGAGRQMLEFLQDWGRRNGIKAICGVCGAKNGAARSFYQRLGFATEEICWISKAIVP